MSKKETAQGGIVTSLGLKEVSYKGIVLDGKVYFSPKLVRFCFQTVEVREVNGQLSAYKPNGKFICKLAYLWDDDNINPYCAIVKPYPKHTCSVDT